MKTPKIFESVLSLIPSANTVNTNPASSENIINSGFSSLNSTVNPIIEGSFASSPPTESVNSLQKFTFVLSVIWLFGLILMLIYSLVSYLKLRSKMKTAVKFENNIRQSENVSSPFILGLFRPQIYIPYNLNGEKLRYVLAHKNDAPVFTPSLNLKEIKAITDKTETENIATGEALEYFYSDAVYDYYFSSIKSDYVTVEFADGTKKTVRQALSDGEIRIDDLDRFNIKYLKYLKQSAESSDLGAYISAIIADHFKKDKPTGLIYVESHFILNEISNPVLSSSPYSNKSVYTVYAIVLYEEYNSKFKSVSEKFMPVAITFDVADNAQYTLKEFWEPESGTGFAESIRNKFPEDIVNSALNYEQDRTQLSRKTIKRFVFIFKRCIVLKLRYRK